MTLKLDYQKQLDSILSTIKNKPTLLLHACCAPCSSYVIEYLSSYFDITIYYYNPNIHPIEEYNRRLTELQNFITKFPPAIKNNISLIIPPYDPEDYFIADSALAWELDKAGFSAKYLDDDAHYYKRNTKLLKWLKKNEIEG